MYAKYQVYTELIKFNHFIYIKFPKKLFLKNHNS